MPSPFPGMDPYLEGSLWTTLHFSLSAEIVRQLAPRLRPRYLVLPVERFVAGAPIPLATIEILHKANRLVVTRIEVIPAIDKRELRDHFIYTTQQNNVHFLELDLLRHNHQGLIQSLPTISVPLLPGDAPVTLDLQQIFTLTYDLLGYELMIDYTQPPEIPLSGRAAAWMDEQLRTAGLRT